MARTQTIRRSERISLSQRQYGGQIDRVAFGEKLVIGPVRAVWTQPRAALRRLLNYG